MPRVAVVLGLLAGVLAAGCGGTQAGSEGAFEYDAEAPLALEEGTRVSRHDPLAVRAVSYASGQDRVEGYLVARHGTTRRCRRSSTSTARAATGRSSFPSRPGSARGAVALTLTLPSGRAEPPKGAPPEETLRWQRDTIVADAVAVRRALDLARGWSGHRALAWSAQRIQGAWFQPRRFVVRLPLRLGRG